MTLSTLITGGSGFVGQHLIRLLQQREASIAVLSFGRTSRSPEERGVHFYEADVRDRDCIAGIVREVNPSHVYHLAAVSAVDVSWANPRLTYEVNFWGTCNVFEAAMKLPAPARILNVSTSQVYARSTERLTETSPIAPDNPYSASKAMSELLSVEFKRSSSGGVVTARPFNHSGPGQAANFFLSAIAKQFAAISLGIAPPKLSVGNIAVKRDFSDVRDVVEAYALLIEKGRVGETYNVCSGVAVRLSDVIKMFEAASKVKVEIVTIPGKIRADDPDEVCGDPTKIRSETGWTPKLSLEKTTSHLLDYWQAILRQERAIEVTHEA